MEVVPIAGEGLLVLERQFLPTVRILALMKFRLEDDGIMHHGANTLQVLKPLPSTGSQVDFETY